MKKTVTDPRTAADLAAQPYREKNENHAVLVFERSHLDSPDAIRDYFEYIKGIYQELGLPISKVSHDRTRRYLSYPRCHRQLTALFPDAKYLEICALPDGVVEPMEYCCSNAAISRKDGAIHIGFESKRAPLRSELWREISTFLMTRFRPAYAYLYERPFDHGPYWYAVCLGTNKKYPHEEEGRISQWTEGVRDDLYLKNGWRTRQQAYQNVDLGVYIARQNAFWNEYRQYVLDSGANMNDLNRVRSALRLGNYVEGATIAVREAQDFWRFNRRGISLARWGRALRITSGAIGLLGTLASNAATAGQIVNPDIEAQVALDRLLMRYRAAVQARLRGDPITPAGTIYGNLSGALATYLAAIEAPNSVHAQVQRQLLWIADSN